MGVIRIRIACPDPDSDLDRIRLSGGLLSPNALVVVVVVVVVIIIVITIILIIIIISTCTNDDTNVTNGEWRTLRWRGGGWWNVTSRWFARRVLLARRCITAPPCYCIANRRSVLTKWCNDSPHFLASSRSLVASKRLASCASSVFIIITIKLFLRPYYARLVVLHLHPIAGQRKPRANFHSLTLPLSQTK